MIYVARRSFKSAGKFYGVGSVITDPTSIKRFRTKVKDKVIVEVTESNLTYYAEYLQVRTGVDFTEQWVKALNSGQESPVDDIQPTSGGAPDKKLVAKVAAVKVK